ncbi:MAG: DUF3313 family protein [Caulobacteraceae bacterium]|nr:DUF3313 family protein [Caulobacteraceae bacterium]
MNRRQLALLAGAGVALLGAPRARAAEAPPTTWDGLVRVPSKKFKLVYLAPGADFRPYGKVIIEPTQVAFNKDWIGDWNNQQMTLEGQISAYDIKNAVAEGVKRASDVFGKAFADGGYQVVTAPGPDVLTVRTGIVDIVVAAPDVMTRGRTFANSRAAGAATFVVEARDSQTNALLGRVVDQRLAGDNGLINRSSVTNRSDFLELAKSWAKDSVGGLNELKTLSPVQVGAAAPSG